MLWLCYQDYLSNYLKNTVRNSDLRFFASSENVLTAWLQFKRLFNPAMHLDSSPSLTLFSGRITLNLKNSRMLTTVYNRRNYLLPLSFMKWEEHWNILFPWIIQKSNSKEWYKPSMMIFSKLSILNCITDRHRISISFSLMNINEMVRLKIWYLLRC